MKKEKTMHILFLLVSFTIFSSCSNFKKILEPPKVKLEEVKISRMSIVDMDLDIILGVVNPNAVDFDVKNLKYILDVNSKTITSGTLKEKVLVKSKDKTVVSLPLTVKYTDLLTSALLLLGEEGMPYKIQGSAEIGPFTVPFNSTGNLKSSDL